MCKIGQRFTLLRIINQTQLNPNKFFGDFILSFSPLFFADSCDASAVGNKIEGWGESECEIIG